MDYTHIYISELVGDVGSLNYVFYKNVDKYKKRPGTFSDVLTNGTINVYFPVTCTTDKNVGRISLKHLEKLGEGPYFARQFN